jgi:hypothetical protein
VAGAGLAGREPGREPDRGRAESVATSRRPVWAIGLLLMLEVAGIAAIGAYEFLQVDWRRIAAAQTLPSWEAEQEVEEILASLVFYAPAVVLTLLSALSLLLIRRRGWLLAAISQGLVVGVSLWLYVQYEPIFVYPIMAYAVLMILYLNVHDVREVFYPGERKRAPRRLP